MQDLHVTNAARDERGRVAAASETSATGPTVGRRVQGYAVHRTLVLAGLCAVTVAGSLAGFLHLNLGTDLAKDVGDASQLLAALTAGAACHRASRRGGADARGWALLSAGAFLWAAAAAVWAVYGLTRDHVYPFPSVADLGFVGFAVPVAAGLLAFPRQASRRVSRVRSTLDGSVITSAVLFASGVTVLGPLVAAEGPALTRLTGLAYPVVDVTIASLVLILALRQPAGSRWTWGLLGGGLVSLTICDSVYVALTIAGQPSIGTPLHAGWVAAWLLIALATLAPFRGAPGPTQVHFNVAQELLPYVPVLVAILALVQVDLAKLQEPLVAATGLLLLAVLIAQQVLVALEKITLTDDLEATVVLRGAQLSQVEERFRSLVDSSADAIVSKTIDGVVTSWNPAAERLYGYPAEEIVGRPASLLVPADRLAEESEILATGARGERRRFETERRRKDGRVVSVSLTVSPIMVGDDVRGISVIGHDITERKRDEAALHAQQLRTRAVIDTASDAFVAMDAAGLITEWNRSAETMFGWSREEAVGRLLAETIVPERHRQAHQDGLARVCAGGEPHVLDQRIEIEARHRDGTELQVELSIWRASESTDDGFNAFLQDITERTRVQQELASARDQALEGSRAKSDFLATMSHEIRTPMNGVIGLCGLLLDTPLDDVQRRYANGVRGSGEALLSIIDDILDFSKLEAGRVELEQVAFDPRQVVEEIGMLLATAASEQGLEIVAYCAPDLPAALRGDPGRLRQILLNLGSNAVKFTASGEVVLSARLVHAADGDEDEAPAVCFSVSDTGIGIDPVVQSRLFQPFSQADASTTRRFGGTGLGLVICQRLVQAMGGEIELDSTAGVGSTFSFTLRLPACPGGPTPQLARPELLRDLRVLVVDDNDTNRTVLSGQLSAWGITATVAARAHDALGLLHAAADRSEPYDVAVLDLCMPDMDGLELAAAIAADHALSVTSTMILTSVGGLDPERARAARVRHWANKPVRSSELHDALVKLATPQSDAPAVPGTPGHPPVPTPRRHRGRVLVVEDNVVNQLVARGVLRKLGYGCDVVADGEQALTALDGADYDVVLMDCHMPVMDGFQATAELRRREEARRPEGRDDGDRGRTPVIAMTAGVLAEDRERCRESGMDDFVAKPVSVDALDQALRRQLPGVATCDGPDEDPPDTAAAEPGVLDPERLVTLGRLDPDGTAGLVDAVVQAFLAEAPERMSAVREAADARLPSDLAQAVHQMKGSVVNLGASRVAALCDRIESLARAGAVPDAATIDQLQVELRRATRALAHLPVVSP